MSANSSRATLARRQQRTNGIGQDASRVNCHEEAGCGSIDCRPWERRVLDARGGARYRFRGLNAGACCAQLGQGSTTGCSK